MEKPIEVLSKGSIKARLAAAANDTEANAVMEEFLTSVQSHLLASVGESATQAERLAAVEKALPDVNEAISGYKETLADYRNHLRAENERPGKGDKIDLRSINRWELPVSSNDNVSQDAVAKSLSRLSVGHYNVLCKQDRDLGIEPGTATSRIVNRFRQLNDELAMQIAYLAAKDPAQLQMHGWKGLPGAEEFTKLATQIGEAVRLAINESSGTGAEGANWVPSDVMSSRILPYVESERLLLNFFEEIAMPNPTYTMGVLGSRIYPKKLVENYTDAGTVTNASVSKQQWTMKNFQFVAAGYATGVIATPWWLEDTVAQGSDFILREGAESMNRGDERWLVNGQASGQIDGGVIATDDIRMVGNGIRYFFSQMVTAAIAAPVDLSAGMTADDLAMIFGKQGRYAHKVKQSIWVASNLALTHALLLRSKTGERIVQTLDVAGGNATFPSGAIATVWGRPIVPSDEVSEAMDANGLEGNGGALSAIYHVYTPAIKVGRRGGMTVGYSTDARFFEHQECFKFVRRSSIKCGYDTSTESTIGAGFGIQPLV